MSSDGFCVVSACSLDRSRWRPRKRSWPRRRCRVDHRVRQHQPAGRQEPRPRRRSRQRQRRTGCWRRSGRSPSSGQRSRRTHLAPRHPRRLVVHTARRPRRHRSHRRRRSRSSTPTTTISSPPSRGPPTATSKSVFACCGRSPAPSREPDVPGTRCPPSTRCWHPPSSNNTRTTGCAQDFRRHPRARLPRSRGLRDLLTRCEERAVDLDDPYGQAIARWLKNMTLDTDRELIAQARGTTSPTPSPWPQSGWPWTPPSTNPTRPTRQCVTPTPPPPSTTAPTSATSPRPPMANRDSSSVTSPSSSKPVTSSSPPGPARSSSSATGSSCTADCSAATAAVDDAFTAAQRFSARQVPGSQQLVDTAEYFLTLLSDAPSRTARRSHRDSTRGRCARDAVDRGEPADRVDRRRMLHQGGTSRQAMAHAISGLVRRSEDDWHAALRLSTEYGLRLIAVDALEALGEAAAASTAPQKLSGSSQPPTGSATRPGTSGATTPSNHLRSGDARRPPRPRRRSRQRLAGGSHAGPHRCPRLRQTGTRRTRSAPSRMGQPHPDRTQSPNSSPTASPTLRSPHSSSWHAEPSRPISSTSSPRPDFGTVPSSPPPSSNASKDKSNAVCPAKARLIGTGDDDLVRDSPLRRGQRVAAVRAVPQVGRVRDR